MNRATSITGYTDYKLKQAYDKVGFPEVKRTQGNHRRLDIEEVHALRDALFILGQHNLNQAAEAAHAAMQDPTSGQHVRQALLGFNEQQAAATMERAFKGLGLRSAIEGSLIQAIEVLAGIEGQSSAAANYAIRWAANWLGSMQRVVTAPARDNQPRVMIFDASSSSETESLHIIGLDLLLRQVGSRVINLSIDAEQHSVLQSIRAIKPNVIVLAGRHIDENGVRTFKNSVCKTLEQTTQQTTPSFLQFRPQRQAGIASIMPQLNDEPGTACDELLAFYDRFKTTARRATTRQQTAAQPHATQKTGHLAANS